MSYVSDSRLPSYGATTTYSNQVTTHHHPNTAVPAKYHNTTVPTGSGLPDTKVTYSVISDQTAEARETFRTEIPVVATQRAVYEKSEPVIVSTSTRPADTTRQISVTTTVDEYVPLDPKTYPRMTDDQWFAATRTGESSPSAFSGRSIVSSSYRNAGSLSSYSPSTYTVDSRTY